MKDDIKAMSPTAGSATPAGTWPSHSSFRLKRTSKWATLQRCGPEPGSRRLRFGMSRLSPPRLDKDEEGRLPFRLVLRFRSPAATRDRTAAEALRLGVCHVELAYSFASIGEDDANRRASAPSPEMSDTRIVFFAIS